VHLYTLVQFIACVDQPLQRVEGVQGIARVQVNIVEEFERNNFIALRLGVVLTGDEFVEPAEHHEWWLTDFVQWVGFNQGLCGQIHEVDVLLRLVCFELVLLNDCNHRLLLVYEEDIFLNMEFSLMV